MAKIIAWLVVIFIVLLALRVINMRNARTRRGATNGAAGTDVEPMVRCVRCGVFLPRDDAAKVTAGYACPDGQCVKR
ncbi:MAG: PP0621 family protein [Burkholderiales bacterium]|jgi:ribosomal protein S26